MRRVAGALMLRRTRVARERAAQDPRGLILGVVRGRDPFLGGAVVVAGRTDLDVADDVIAQAVQRRHRRGGIDDAVNVVHLGRWSRLSIGQKSLVPMSVALLKSSA